MVHFMRFMIKQFKEDVVNLAFIYITHVAWEGRGDGRERDGEGRKMSVSEMNDGRDRGSEMMNDRKSS